MYHLQWGKIIGLCIFLTFSQLLAAQKNDRGVNYKDFQNKPYYFGLSLGATNSNFKIFHSQDFIQSDSLLIAESINGPGLTVGIVTNLKLGEHIDLRMIPAFNFAERNINYKGNSSFSETTNTIESVFFDVPFQVRYKSLPYKDIKLYVLGGLKYTFDISSKSRTKRFNDLIRVTPHDFSVEAGAGIQFFLPFFIFSPEIKITQGIGNTLIYRNNFSKSKVIDKLLNRTFTISFHLEG